MRPASLRKRQKMDNKKNPSWWTIRRKLLLLLFIVFLPAFGIIVTTGLQQRKAEIEKAENSASLLAQSLAAHQDQVVIATKTMLSMLAQLPVVQSLDAKACSRLFRELHHQYPFYSVILAATPDGNVFAASTPFQSGVNLADRKHVRDAIRTRDFSAGEHIVGRISNMRSINFSYPVFGADRKVAAVVIAGINLNEYAHLVAEINPPEGYAVAILDWKGVRLFRLPESRGAPHGTPVSRKAFADISGNSDHGLREWTSHDGMDRIYAFRQLRLRADSPPYMFMVVGMPKDKVLHNANVQMARNLSILGLAALIAMCLAWVFGNFFLIEPVDRLVTATRMFGQGKMYTRTGLSRTTDELGRLAESFDDMASLLEKRNKEHVDAEKRQELENRLLKTLNSGDEISGVVRRIPALMREYMEIEAVGVRLRVGEDFPYLESEGFSEQFLQPEQSLLTHDDKGKILRDRTGKPVMACICGAVISRKTDPSLPFFTDGGSFWTNDASAFSASVSPEAFQGPLRGRCIRENYESLAIIPLKSGEEIIGVLQLNDRRRDSFDLSLIEYFEGIAASIGIALSRKEAEKRVSTSEAKFRHIYEQAFEGIFQATPTGKLININPSLARMHGYQSPEEMVSAINSIGHQLYVDPEDRVKYRKIIETQGFIERWETRMYQKDGNIIWVSISAHAIKGSSGEILHYEGMVENITHRREAEVSLRNALTELEGKNQELESAYREQKESQKKIIQQEKMASIGQLAAGVAHEINNPMGFIISNLNSLNKYLARIPEFIKIQSEVIDQLSRNADEHRQTAVNGAAESRRALKIDYIVEDSQSLIKESLDGADRVKRIVQDLKNFSRIDEPEYSLADLNKTMESTLNIVWNELKYKAAVKKEYGDMPMTLCNAGQLGQVFMNILLNAAQSIEEFGEIAVRTFRDGKDACVTISDTGCGIPEDQLGRIFEPFYTTKEIGKGTGLGLSIVYDIVKKHEGDIEVTSEPGKGTTFIIKVPIKEC